MIDVFKVADALVAYTRRHYADDVALVVYYGSHATGTATPTSDLDLYYIPADGAGERAGALYRSFVVGDVPFEFWPVSWSFAERIAAGKHHWSVAPSLIANAVVLYARSGADRARFDGLKQRIADLQTPQQRPVMVTQALEAYRSLAFPLTNLQLACDCGDLPGARVAACALVDAALDCLALLSQTFFAKNWASNLEQVQALSVRPIDLAGLIRVIFTSGDLAAVQAAAHTLAADTRARLLAEHGAMRHEVSATEAFRDFYPSIKEFVNKVLSACDRRDLLAASYAAARIQGDVAQMLDNARTGIDINNTYLFSEYRFGADALALPDLSQVAATGDMNALASAARQFDGAMREYLQRNGAALNDVASLDELTAFINEPSRPVA
jgi:hypothetical protein